MVRPELLAKIMVIHITQGDNKETMIICDEPQLVKIENKEINKEINNSIKINKKPKDTSCQKPCWCYNKDSQDMRCCGLCYTFCYITNKQEQCYVCPETFELYYTSGYVITTCGYGHTDDDCQDCVPTTMCLPLKLPMFFTCLVGSIVNNCINNCRDTNTNYLF